MKTQEKIKGTTRKNRLQTRKTRTNIRNKKDMKNK